MRNALVVIGASAGGVASLQALLSNITTGDEATYLIVQQALNLPERQVVTLLNKYAKLPIYFLPAGQRLQLSRGCCYWLSAGTYLEFKSAQNVRVCLETTPSTPSPSLDRLLTT